jgi:hypothetical protein
MGTRRPPGPHLLLESRLQHCISTSIHGVLRLAARGHCLSPTSNLLFTVIFDSFGTPKNHLA